MNNIHKSRTKAQESTKAIERLYITMQHLFYRGSYKPIGISGETLCESLLELRPEIYGSIAEEKIELNGLLYVKERLPEGIEQCRFVNITSEEGYGKSHFKVIIPPKRKRNSYRIDEEQMTIEVTRSKSDIYDILTHLTFIFIESHKIRKRVLNPETNEIARNWQKIEQLVLHSKNINQSEKEKAIAHLTNVLGRTYDEIDSVYTDFATESNPHYLLSFIYWMGKIAIDEIVEDKFREITFSPLLQERLGHHIHTEIWATTIKKALFDNGLLQRPIHIISANMHSVMNSLFAQNALQDTEVDTSDAYSLYNLLSQSGNKELRNQVFDFAETQGMIYIKDESGATIDVQLFDTAKIDFSKTSFLQYANHSKENAPVLMVMDYAFGEQAFGAMDEFFKPYTDADDNKHFMNVASVSIMGKAGILEGKKGDIMIPTAHIHEGTADNYPFKNELTEAHFCDNGLGVYSGSMVTVLGTSLQNKNLLQFFNQSTWQSIGLEMEGAHYQKAIQAASKIRKSIREDVKLRYAYYASDNPLETGSTLASGGLGLTGVKPTYLITIKILEQVLGV